jgi:solute:Na+ symporter, SSS family
MAIKITVVALYALMIVIIGLIGLRKTKSFNDFFLGGGNIGPWMTAFSYGTAYFSAVLFHRLCWNDRLELWIFRPLDCIF